MDRWQLFLAVMGIVEDIISHADQIPGGKKPWLLDRRCNDADPGQYRTRSGLFLQFRCQRPVSLWTPWGVWRFGRGCDDSYSWREANLEILEKLGAQICEAATDCTKGGVCDLVYGLHCYDGKELPEPVVSKGRGGPIEIEELTREWKTFKGRYEKEY